MCALHVTRPSSTSKCKTMHCLLYLYNVRSDSITLMIIPFLVLLVGVSAVNAEWVEEGIPICAESGWQMVPHIVSDGEAGAIITWWDDRSGDRAIYAQRINPYGRLLWDAAGVRLSAENNHQYSKYTISDGSGGALIAWEDSPHDSYTSIYIQRINGSGEVLWNRDGIWLGTIPQNLRIYRAVCHTLKENIDQFGRMTRLKESGSGIFQMARRSLKT